ncbi:endonuclease/exonuclease/phosphatase family protein [Chthonobacter albigriseus]|uniref:endonuclease/exonuclease/phosphatase family protein n=1 Tax=Chthonobacter albigriseus TaxID=1683161 RepID=UPI0019D5B300|nr:endonuclease/exonuclease/phosphatase family protein [Chthonobacter albigriseus]
MTAEKPTPPSPLRLALTEFARERGTTRQRLGRLVDSILPQAAADFLFPPAPERGAKVVVASYNIHKCVGTDGRFDPERIAEVIAELDADVVCLQEADRRIGLRNGLLDLPGLERRTGLTLVPVAARPASHGWHGNAILVRQGEAIRIKRLTLPHAEPRGAVMAELDLPVGKLRVVGAHLGLLRRSRAQQAATLLQTLDRSEPMPTVLMGDFNEWRPGRPDCPLAALEPFFGPVHSNHPSFPSRRPIFALDRILGWPHGTVETIAVHASPLARVASDHLPIKALVDLSTPLPNADVAAATV